MLYMDVESINLNFSCCY